MEIIKLFNLRKFLNVIVGVIIAYLLFIYGYALIMAPVNADAGYYLNIAKEISKGQVPYKDFPLFYMPLGIYFFSLVSFFVSDTTSYWPYLSLLFAFHWLNAYLIYKIALTYSDKYSSFLLGASYLLIVFHIQGTHIALEPFVVFFSLLATMTYLYHPKKENAFLLCGIFCSLAFLSKQYGLGVFLLIASFSTVDLFKSRISFRNYAALVFGFISALILFTLICLAQSVTTRELFEQMFGISYGKHSIEQWLSFFLEFLLEVNFLVVLFVSLILLVLERKVLNKEILFHLAATVGFSLQFYFENFYHYGIIIVPFLLLLLSHTLYTLKINQWHNYYTFLLSFAFLLFFQKNIRTFRWNIKDWNRKEQYKVASQIKVFTEGKRTFIPDYPEYTFILNTPSVDPKRVGYSFAGSLSKGLLDTIVTTSQVLVLSAKEPNRFLDLNKVNELYKVEKKYGTIMILTNKMYPTYN